MFESIIAVILIVIIFTIFIIFKFSRQRKLTSYQKKAFLKNLTDISKISSSKEKIIDLDKLYHLILKGLGYKGSFGDILKSEPREVINLNKIWELHKIRNKLVHEFENIDKTFLEKKAREYEREVRRLLKRV